LKALFKTSGSSIIIILIASKGIALKELSEHLGIKQSEVMAIGDAENDLSMIEFAGTGIKKIWRTANKCISFKVVSWDFFEGFV
jgi:3-deoxy-D-manno-octulosonate 8-phosphate phosphatase KdsC-like HAD superfamily phosphatase